MWFAELGCFGYVDTPGYGTLRAVVWTDRVFFQDRSLCVSLGMARSVHRVSFEIQRLVRLTFLSHGLDYQTHLIVSQLPPYRFSSARIQPLKPPWFHVWFDK